MTNVRTITMDDALPQLRIPWPVCGHCGSEVEIDDGTAWCTTCRIEWRRVEDGEVAVPDRDREGADVPCGIVTGPQLAPEGDGEGTTFVPGPPKPCILPSGHEGKHICPYDVEVTDR